MPHHRFRRRSDHRWPRIHDDAAGIRLADVAEARSHIRQAAAAARHAVGGAGVPGSARAQELAGVADLLEQLGALLEWNDPGAEPPPTRPG